ncbi:Ataxin-10 [Coemansia sp. RSA 1933]|nr:Ataxin-10 [Coemansia sp. RSA 1933]
MAGLVLVLNTINGDPELVELLCTASPGQQLVRKLGTLFGNIQDDRSEEKDLLYTILSKVIEHSCISILVSKDPTLETYGLYEALAVYCKIRHADNADCAGSIFDKRLVQSFSKILEQTHSVLSGLWHVSAPGEPAACNDVNMESAMAAHRCLTAILSVLETVTLSHSQRLADLAIECKLAHRIVELLGLLNINLPRIQRLGSQSTDESQTTSIERLFMFKRDLIQIIGNLAYKNTRMQDLMRELDGLSLVLDNMRIDDNHPFIKEYAIVALKWLLENNQASHDYVRSIEDGKPVLDPSISTSGLQVNMDDKGKISSSANKADK